MFRLFESIRLESGKFQNLEMHHQRISRSSKALLGKDRADEIIEELTHAARPTDGVYKARLQYDADTETIGYIPYTMRVVASLKIVNDDSIGYAHKFTDRSRVEELFSQRENGDDIIIVRNGWVTDSSYSNLIFKRKNTWLTPAQYLLRGTMRETLLQNGIIKEEEIRAADIFRFEKVKLINAMMGMNGPEIEIENILR